METEFQPLASTKYTNQDIPIKDNGHKAHFKRVQSAKYITYTEGAKNYIKNKQQKEHFL